MANSTSHISHRRACCLLLQRVISCLVSEPNLFADLMADVCEVAASRIDKSTYHDNTMTFMHFMRSTAISGVSELVEYSVDLATGWTHECFLFYCVAHIMRHTIMMSIHVTHTSRYRYIREETHSMQLTVNLQNTKTIIDCRTYSVLARCKHPSLSSHRTNRYSWWEMLTGVQGLFRTVTVIPLPRSRVGVDPVHLGTGQQPRV